MAIERASSRRKRTASGADEPEGSGRSRPRRDASSGRTIDYLDEFPTEDAPPSPSQGRAGRNAGKAPARYRLAVDTAIEQAGQAGVSVEELLLAYLAKPDVTPVRSAKDFNLSLRDDADAVTLNGYCRRALSPPE